MGVCYHIGITPDGKVLDIMQNFDKLDELLKTGELSDGEISSRFNISEDSVKRRRGIVDKALEKSKPAIIKEVASEYLSLVRECQQEIAPIAKGILDHIRFHIDSGEIIPPIELNLLSQTLTRVQATLRVGNDETQKAILHLLEADILPEQTSAEIINAFEESSESVRRETRRIISKAPQETTSQLSLL
jgi:hypothetical protein